MIMSGIRGAALAAIAAVGLASAPSAHASVFTFTVTEQGGNVDVSGYGSIDLAGLTHVSSGGGLSSYTWPSLGRMVVGGNFDTYSGVSGPDNFGSGSGPIDADNATGDTVGIFVTELVVPSGYASGAQLSDGMTFDGATFASLGLTPGSYIYTWGASNSLAVDVVVPRAVPEPSTWAMLALGFIGLAALGLRRSEAKTASA
jgi:PEP-CTERM motif